MDINKENNLVEENVSDTTETIETEVEEIVTESDNTKEILAEEADEEVPILSVDTDDVDEGVSTLLVDMDDIDEELMRYGIESGETEEVALEVHDCEPEKKRTVQKPIMIAAVSFLITVVLVLGAYFLYGLLAPKGIEGTWVQADSENPTLFLTFDDGTVTMNVGGYQRYGYYEVNEAKGVDVLSTEFYELAVIGSNIAVTYSENGKEMTLHFLYEDVDLNTTDTETVGFESLEMGSISFVREKAPKLSIDADDITHASADEFGITAVNIDDKIIGTWHLGIDGAEGKYNTYTFNADGTGTHDVDYVYYELYGCGLGENSQFKYTVYEDKILLTTTYFDGTTSDQILEYFVDNGNLVLDGVGYENVE